jgi:hypothetical protein
MSQLLTRDQVDEAVKDGAISASWLDLNARANAGSYLLTTAHLETYLKVLAHTYFVKECADAMALLNRTATEVVASAGTIEVPWAHVFVPEASVEMFNSRACTFITKSLMEANTEKQKSGETLEQKFHDMHQHAERRSASCREKLCRLTKFRLPKYAAAVLKRYNDAIRLKHGRNLGDVLVMARTPRFVFIPIITTTKLKSYDGNIDNLPDLYMPSDVADSGHHMLCIVDTVNYTCNIIDPLHRELPVVDAFWNDVLLAYTNSHFFCSIIGFVYETRRKERGVIGNDRMFRLVVCNKDGRPQQTTKHDCGFFVLLYAELVLLGGVAPTRLARHDNTTQDFVSGVFRPWVTLVMSGKTLATTQ